MPVISLIKDNLQDFTSYIKGDQITWYWSVDGVVEDKEGALKQSLWRNNYKIYVFGNKYICEILCRLRWNIIDWAQWTPEHWSLSRTCRTPAKLTLYLASLKTWLTEARCSKLHHYCLLGRWSRRCSCTGNTGSGNSLGRNTWSYEIHDDHDDVDDDE